MRRFTETTKWHDPWFQKLSPLFKCLWLYICDNCDCAGVWHVNATLAEFMIGQSIPWDDALESFSERVEIITDDRWWIIRFVEFQYKTLSRECKAHNPIFQLLEKHGLLERVLNPSPGAAPPPDGTPAQSTGEQDSAEPPAARPTAKKENRFEEFWTAYPKKKSKDAALKAWNKRKPSAETLAQMLAAIAAQRETKDWKKDGGQFIPYPATWLNAGGWQDEIKIETAAEESEYPTVEQTIAARERFIRQERGEAEA